MAKDNYVEEISRVGTKCLVKGGINATPSNKLGYIENDNNSSNIEKQ